MKSDNRRVKSHGWSDKERAYVGQIAIPSLARSIRVRSPDSRADVGHAIENAIAHRPDEQFFSGSTQPVFSSASELHVVRPIDKNDHNSFSVHSDVSRFDESSSICNHL